MKYPRLKYKEKQCVYCGEPVEEVDHIVPRARGGEDKPENKMPICKKCNRMKGAKPPLYFIQEVLKRNVFPRPEPPVDETNIGRWFPIGTTPVCICSMEEGSFVLTKRLLYCKCDKFNGRLFNPKYVCHHRVIEPYNYYLKVAYGDRRRGVAQVSLCCARELGLIPNEIRFCQYKKHKFQKTIEWQRDGQTSYIKECISCGYKTRELYWGDMEM